MPKRPAQMLTLLADAASLMLAPNHPGGSGSPWSHWSPTDGQVAPSDTHPT